MIAQESGSAQAVLWDRRQIKQKSKKAAFGKGPASWLGLVLVCAFFSFIGIVNSSATAFIGSVDEMLGLAPENPVSNAELLKEHILQEKAFSDLPVPVQNAVVGVIDPLSQDFTWLINLLAANAAYFSHNAAEIWAYLLVAAVFSGLLRFFIQNALVIGKYRYGMEHRFQRRTPFRRIFAPFHRKYLFSIVWVTFRTYLALSLWWLTIIGGFYKTYQYRMIPYLLAENPAVSFRDAKALSKAMTKGVKWKMFCLDLSLWYIWVLKWIPVAGLLAALPYETAKEAEVYFVLRARVCREETRTVFCERTFDADGIQEVKPAFLLRDIVSKEEASLAPSYRAADLILLFFLFCLIGWVWEVLLHLVQYHEFVNRGTLYGPWLPIYGAGGVLCLLVLDRYKENPLKTFLLIMVLAGGLEFAASWGLDFFLNASYWSYKGWFGNLNGRICLAGLLVFAIGGSFAIYIVGPYMKKVIARISLSLQYIFCTALCICFGADLIWCFLCGFNSAAGPAVY